MCAAALFTGGDRTQQIKMWDIREQECVYELSTGNNAVSAMAWDAAHASLFVATACPHVNRMGERAGYRRARIPAWATWASVAKDHKAYKAAGPQPNPRRSILIHDANGDVVGDEDDERGYYDLGSEDEEDEGEEEIDEAYSADMRWPDKCFHKENYFGYAYDAGENMLCAYSPFCPFAHCSCAYSVRPFSSMAFQRRARYHTAPR